MALGDTSAPISVYVIDMNDENKGFMLVRISCE